MQRTEIPLKEEFLNFNDEFIEENKLSFAENINLNNPKLKNGIVHSRFVLYIYQCNFICTKCLCIYFCE